MTDDALSGPQLEKAIAEAMGWEQREIAAIDGRIQNVPPYPWSQWFDPKNSGSPPHGKIPSFSASLDALSAGPERLLREGGAWEITSEWFRTSEGVEVFETTIHMIGHRSAHVGRGATEAEARARAALAALRVLATESEETK